MVQNRGPNRILQFTPLNQGNFILGFVFTDTAITMDTSADTERILVTANGWSIITI